VKLVTPHKTTGQVSECLGLREMNVNLN